MTRKNSEFVCRCWSLHLWFVPIKPNASRGKAQYDWQVIDLELPMTDLTDLYVVYYMITA